MGTDKFNIILSKCNDIFSKLEKVTDLSEEKIKRGNMENNMAIKKFNIEKEVVILLQNKPFYGHFLQNLKKIFL